MYKDLVPLLCSDTDLKLPPFGACLPDKNPIVVPIAPIEAPRLSEAHPIVWRKSGHEWELVCLTGLARDVPIAGALKNDGTAGTDGLPLILAAFPFTVLEKSGTDEFTILRDPTIVAEETGLPVFDTDGEISPDTERRCQALWTFVADRRRSISLMRDLAAEDVFVPWDLIIPQRGTRIDGLYCVDERFFGSAGYVRILSRHGLAAAHLLTMHRISIFRILVM